MMVSDVVSKTWIASARAVGDFDRRPIAHLV
jgi:hypothetical protein